MIPKALHSSKFMEQTERVVRINSISSGLTALDLEAVLTGPSLPDALFLPKVEDIGDIEKVSNITWVSTISECADGFIPNTVEPFS